MRGCLEADDGDAEGLANHHARRTADQPSHEVIHVEHVQSACAREERGESRVLLKMPCQRFLLGIQVDAIEGELAISCRLYAAALLSARSYATPA